MCAKPRIFGTLGAFSAVLGGVFQLRQALGANLIAGWDFEDRNRTVDFAEDPNLPAGNISPILGGQGFTVFNASGFVLDNDVGNGIRAPVNFSITVPDGYKMTLTGCSFQMSGIADNETGPGNMFTINGVKISEWKTTQLFGLLGTLPGDGSRGFNPPLVYTDTVAFTVDPVRQIDNIMVSGTVDPVPEPSSALVFFLAAGVLTMRRRTARRG